MTDSTRWSIVQFGRGLALFTGAAVGAAIFWAGGNSPAQAQGACICPAGYTPIVIQNPASPLFNNRPDHMACSAGPGLQQACGSSSSGSSSSNRSRDFTPRLDYQESLQRNLEILKIMEEAQQAEELNERARGSRERWEWEWGGEPPEQTGRPTRWEREQAKKSYQQWAREWGGRPPEQPPPPDDRLYDTPANRNLPWTLPGFIFALPDLIRSGAFSPPSSTDQSPYFQNPNYVPPGYTPGNWTQGPGSSTPSGVRPRRLGMDIAPPIPVHLYAFGGVSQTRSSGAAITDVNGATAPGATTPSAKSTAGDVGVVFTANFTRFLNLPAYQSLSFAGAFQYRNTNATFGVSPGAGAAVVANGGSQQIDQYTFVGALFYKYSSLYARAAVGYGFGQGSEQNFLNNSQANYDTSNHFADLKAGNIFVLANTLGASRAAIIAKAPPRQTRGYALTLDLSGHVGYGNSRVDSFIDSTAFIYGPERLQDWMVGGQAKLRAILPGYGVAWMPYVSASIDQFFGLSHTMTVPDQPGQIADQFSYGHAKTFFTGAAGLDIRTVGNLTTGASVYYSESTETKTVGGRGFVKILF